jgi:ATP-dependent helicase/nuclease subunit A
MEVLELFTGKAGVVQKQWPGKKAQAVAEEQRWDRFQQQFAEPLLLAWREHRYEPVMRAIRPALLVYGELRRERGGLNFQDLLLRSVALLRDKPVVRRYFRDRFTHLLVDEFQDTDPLQAEVMLLLTAEDPEEANWEKCRPVAGSLFVVGDPKQSIYRFRRADIQTYGKVRAIMENAGGAIVPLTANFRSVQSVIDWVNGCFNEVFPASADAYSPANRPLEVGRTGESGESDGSKDRLAVARLLIPAALKHQDLIAEHEADLIARTIRRALDERWLLPRTEAERARGAPDYATPGDFLIVARLKSRLTTYARKLQQHGIPHLVTGGSVLNEVPELALLQACLTAVSRSDDPVALVAVLRSELFGVADTVLYEFRRLGGRFSYHSRIPEELAEVDAAVLRDAFERLREYGQWLRRLPAAAAIERIAADLGLVARACAAEEGDAHAGSLLKAIELLRAADGPLTAGDYVGALGRLVDHSEMHDGVPVRPPAETPVRVMNLHQCKGLEAPVVFLADPSGESEHDVGVHIDRSGDKPRGYLAVYGPKRSQWGRPPVLAQPPGWNRLAAHEQRFLDAEAHRLLYVAATRAGVQLVISQREGNANQKNPWQLFDARLQSAEPFNDPGPVPLKPPATLVIDATEWNEEVEAIERRWNEVIRPTYAVQAIKVEAIQGGARPHGEQSGGAEWGEVLHVLLEAAMKHPRAELGGLAASALESVGLPVALFEEAVGTVQRVAGSPVWRRAQAAVRCLTEVPLALPVASAEAVGGLPTVRRGVIDLVFLESAGWVIVDYKSERVPASDVPALVAFYRPQVEAYATAWETAVGQPVAERGLFFTNSGEYVVV